MLFQKVPLNYVGLNRACRRRRAGEKFELFLLSLIIHECRDAIKWQLLYTCEFRAVSR